MNPIESLFQRILQFAFDLVREIINGFLGVPAKVVDAAWPELHIRETHAAELIDLRHKVLRPGRPRDTAHFSGDDDPKTRHWVADHQGAIVAIASVMAAESPDGVPDAAWQLRGMAVEPDWSRKGIGAILLTAVEGAVAEPMWCNARESAQAFYQRGGWVSIGDAFVIEPIGPHKRMHRAP